MSRRRGRSAGGLRAAASLGRQGLALAQRMQSVSGAALKPWLKAWGETATEQREQWLHDHSMPAASGRWVRGLAMDAGGMRQFQLYLPAGPPRRPALPLMVMLHGCQQDAAGFAHSTRMHRLADREGFAVLYPQQDRRANAQGCWNWFDQRHGRAQHEARLVLAAIDQVCLLHGVDRSRVAVAGLSAGASLAAALAQWHAARLAAVIMHSGVAPGLAHDARGALAAMQGRSRSAAGAATAAVAAAAAATAAATASAPLALAAAPQPAWPALLVIHGDRDRVVSPRNAVQAVVQWVAQGRGVAGAPVLRQRGQRLAAEVTRWRRQGRDIAELVMVRGLGHGWSGGPASLPFGEPSGPDASLMALRFAQRQWAAVAAVAAAAAPP